MCMRRPEQDVRSPLIAPSLFPWDLEMENFPKFAKMETFHFEMVKWTPFQLVWLPSKVWGPPASAPQPNTEITALYTSAGPCLLFPLMCFLEKRIKHILTSVFHCSFCVWGKFWQICQRFVKGVFLPVFMKCQSIFVVKTFLLSFFLILKSEWTD